MAFAGVTGAATTGVGSGADTGFGKVGVRATAVEGFVSDGVGTNLSEEAGAAALPGVMAVTGSDFGNVGVIGLAGSTSFGSAFGATGSGLASTGAVMAGLFSATLVSGAGFVSA